MFNSVTLKNTHQTEPQKYIVLSTKQTRVGGYNKKNFFRNKVFFTFPKITVHVRGFVNQLTKHSGLIKCSNLRNVVTGFCTYDSLSYEQEYKISISCKNFHFLFKWYIPQSGKQFLG